MQSDALWVLIDTFFLLVTTSTNSPLQFGWFRLKTEVRIVCFVRIKVGECMKMLVIEWKKVS